ncbi:MAG: hypothetical protein ABI594_01050 [Ginsengibacter sp.]
MISLKPGFVKRIKRTNNFPIFAVLFLLVITSCNPSLRFASVKYDAADINRLLDNTNMDYLTIQNNATNAGNYKKPFTLISYARTADGDFVDTVGYDLQPVEGIKPKAFKGKTELGNFIFTRDEILDILTDSTGHRNTKFASLILTPFRDKANGYLYFDVRANNINQTMGGVSAAVVLRPCPPATWCRPKAIKTGKIINQ